MNFYSEDLVNVNNNEKKNTGALCIKEITDDIQIGHNLFQVQIKT